MRPIWHSKEWFSAQLLVKRGTKTPCIDCLKKDTIALYAYCQFVMYRLKIVTHKIYGHGSKSKTVLKETKDRITCSVTIFKIKIQFQHYFESKSNNQAIFWFIRTSVVHFCQSVGRFIMYVTIFVCVNIYTYTCAFIYTVLTWYSVTFITTVKRISKRP